MNVTSDGYKMFKHTWNIPNKERCEALIERDVSFQAYLKGLPTGQHTCGREITKCLRKQTAGSKFCWQHKRIFEESDEFRSKESR